MIDSPWGTNKMRYMDLRTHFLRFKKWAKAIPKEQRRSANVSFRQWMGGSEYFSRILPYTVYACTPEQVERAKLLEGPNAYALFHVWVAQRCQ